MPSKMASQIRSNDSLAYLTGLRGIAALFVYNFHLSYPFTDKAITSYQDPTQSSIWQLPILRITYAGYQMVALFFALSGLVLSARPLTLATRAALPELLTNISSSVFRRVFRLYVPLLPCMILVAILAYMGCFEHSFSMVNPSVAGRKPIQQDSFFDQITDMMHFLWWTLLDFLSAYRKEPESVYGAHLWTIPREFRGSMILYLTILGTALLCDSASFWSSICVVVYFYVFSMWDVSLFAAGMMILRYQHHSIFTDLGARTQLFCSTATLTVGVYLASLPVNHAGPTGFTGNQFSMVCGVALILQSIVHHQAAQQFLSWRPIHFLGDISFSLYIIHEPILRLFGWRLVEFLTESTGGSFAAGLTISWIILTPLVLGIATVYWQFVDKPAIHFSKWLQKQLTVGPHIVKGHSGGEGIELV